GGGGKGVGGGVGKGGGGGGGGGGGVVGMLFEPHQQAVLGQEADQALTNPFHAGPVVAAAVDVDEVAQQLKHRRLLRGKPGRHLGFVGAEFGHRRPHGSCEPQPNAAASGWLQPQRPAEAMRDG